MGSVKLRKNGVFEVCETNFVRTRLTSTRPPFSVFFREWISKTSCFITLKNRTTCKFLFWHQGCLFYQEAVREFAYGQQYAWMLVIFTLMVVFCLTCPLVTPFGKSRKTFSSRLQTFIMGCTTYSLRARAAKPMNEASEWEPLLSQTTYRAYRNKNYRGQNYRLVIVLRMQLKMCCLAPSVSREFTQHTV